MRLAAQCSSSLLPLPPPLCPDIASYVLVKQVNWVHLAAQCSSSLLPLQHLLASARGALGRMPARRQHTRAEDVSIRQHSAACVSFECGALASMRLRESFPAPHAVSIRQHTSACVSVRASRWEARMQRVSRGTCRHVASMRRAL